jgi:hypothetical protein
MRITIFGVKTVILQTNWNMKNEIVQINESEYKAILLQAVAVLPWSHNLLLINKGLNDEDTLYYAHEVISKGWNRDLLLNALKILNLPNCLYIKKSCKFFQSYEKSSAKQRNSFLFLPRHSNFDERQSYNIKLIYVNS